MGRVDTFRRTRRNIRTIRQIRMVSGTPSEGIVCWSDTHPTPLEHPNDPADPDGLRKVLSIGHTHTPYPLGTSERSGRSGWPPAGLRKFLCVHHTHPSPSEHPNDPADPEGLRKVFDLGHTHPTPSERPNDPAVSDRSATAPPRKSSRWSSVLLTQTTPSEHPKDEYCPLILPDKYGVSSCAPRPTVERW